MCVGHICVENVCWAHVCRAAHSMEEYFEYYIKVFRGSWCTHKEAK